MLTGTWWWWKKMTDDLLNDPALNPPGRPDFRRVGKGVPLVLDPDTGKMVRRRRSSSAGKVLDDESNLTDWKLRTVLVGAAQLPEVLAAVSVLDPDQDKKAIRDHVEECLQAGKGNRRKVQGQAVHAMFDHVDLEHDWQPAPQFRAAVQAYVDMRDAYGLVPEDVEVPCVNDTFGLAGTADRRYRTTRALVAPDGTIIPIGSILVGDTKTGLSLEYAAGTYATQIAAYVDSVRYDVLTDERQPFDPPNYPDWALVVHALPEQATCELYWVDVQQGRAGLALAHQVWQWRRSTGLLTPAPPPLRAVPDAPTIVPEPSEQQSAPPNSIQPPDGSGAPWEYQPTEDEMAATQAEVKEWLRTRVLAIKAHSDVAAQHLARKWPEGVPGLKAEGHTWEQLTALEGVIDMVETEHSVPWPDTDPRLLASRAHHPSAGRDWSDRWSKPQNDDQTPPEQVELLRDALMNHPRRLLLKQWLSEALLGEPEQFDRYALVTALYEFAMLPVDEWSDDDVTTMLVGTLNAMNYPGGLADLGRVKPEEAPTIMSAVFAITSGTAMLMFDADDKPVVRFNVKESN
jgi:hypothetical protein